MKVLITGASSGIGKDMAKIFAKKKDSLILVARNERALNELAEELRKEENVEVLVYATDLSVEENCIELHRNINEVDILINNAGFGDCGIFSKTNLEKDLRMIKTNITAYHILTKLYLEDMKRRDKGIILNVASIAGFMPGPLMATYYATKNYVVRLSEAIREELRKEHSKVQISLLCPGPVNTNFNKNANVVFKLKGANSMDVSNYAIRQLEKGKFYIMPGIGVKIARIGAHIVPSSFLSKLIYNVQKRKIQK